MPPVTVEEMDHHQSKVMISDSNLNILDTKDYNGSDSEELSERLQKFAKEELGEDSDVKAESLKEVRSWLSNCPHLCHSRTDANFLLRFLRIQKHKKKEACSMLEKYMVMRAQHPQWFQQLDIRQPALADLVARGYLFALPERDAMGRRVVFSVASALDPQRHTSSDAMRAHIMTFEALLEEEETQLRGFTYIFDCSGITFSHLSIWSPAEVAKLFSICEKNLPMRHRDINLLHLPFPMWAVFEFCKSLLSSKIRKRFSVHSNLTKLQTKLGESCEVDDASVVGAACEVGEACGDDADTSTSFLPKEYGGRVPLQQLAGQWVQVLEERRERLLDLDRVAVAEITQTVKKTKEKKGLWGLFSSES